MLRCPTCLSTLPDGGEKRCPHCRARIRSPRTDAGDDDSELSARPRVLLERELQARIEAKTAARLRQRRRAAKAARRIASLPPTVLQGDVLVDDHQPTANAAGASSAASVVVDLPASAIREVTPGADAPHTRAFVDTDLEIDADRAVTDPVRIGRIITLAPEVTVAAETVASSGVDDEAGTEPVSAKRRRRRRAPKAAPPRAEPEAEPAPVTAAAAEAEEIDAVAASEPPEPAERREPAEESELPERAGPVRTERAESVEVVGTGAPPVTTTSIWDRPNPVWVNRVFNNDRRFGRPAAWPGAGQTATWPRPRPPKVDSDSV